MNEDNRGNRSNLNWLAHAWIESEKENPITICSGVQLIFELVILPFFCDLEMVRSIVLIMIEIKR